MLPNRGRRGRGLGRRRGRGLGRRRGRGLGSDRAAAAVEKTPILLISQDKAFYDKC